MNFSIHKSKRDAMNKSSINIIEIQIVKGMMDGFYPVGLFIILFLLLAFGYIVIFADQIG
jgi:hypothetical protein